MSNPTISRGDLVNCLYGTIAKLTVAVAAINDVDSTLWNDRAAAEQLWLAYDSLDKLARAMAIRARLVPAGGKTDELCTLDAIAAAIQQRASQPEYAEDRYAARADYRRHIAKETAECPSRSATS